MSLASVIVLGKVRTPVEVAPRMDTVPVKAGLARGAYPVREGIRSVVVMFFPPRVAVPVKAGLAKGAYPERLGIRFVVAIVCPPRVAVPVKAGLAKGA